MSALAELTRELAKELIKSDDEVDRFSQSLCLAQSNDGHSEWEGAARNGAQKSL